MLFVCCLFVVVVVVGGGGGGVVVVVAAVVVVVVVAVGERFFIQNLSDQLKPLNPPSPPLCTTYVANINMTMSIDRSVA